MYALRWLLVNNGPMKIDETLAKGLTKQLVTAWHTEAKAAFSHYSTALKKLKLNSRNAFPKFIEMHRKCFKNLSIAYVVGGSKRKPFIGMVVVDFGSKRYLDWTENSLGGIIDVINLVESQDEPDQQVGGAMFFIGEHAVSRVYQRSINLEENKTLNPLVVISEFSLVPLWSIFWIFTLWALEGLSEDKLETICPLIPAPNGMFLCKLSNIGKSARLRTIEVRTFVQTDSLTDEQKEIREVMLHASEHIQNSTLCLYPKLHLLKADMDLIQVEISVVHDLMLYKIKSITDKLSREIIHGDFNAYELNRALQVCFKQRQNDQYLSFMDATLKEKGYDGFVDAIHKMDQKVKSV